jgi:mannan endo-1,4-beta-mannosidase
MAWTPIGHNDAITWPTLAGLFRRRNLCQVENYLQNLVEHGVTCIRVMLEYAQTNDRYIEDPLGRFVPAMVELWDDLFAFCERVGLKLLLTPFDTFWTWQRWHSHPYSRACGGVLEHPSRLLLCRKTRAAIKQRLTFAIHRWGGSSALFAWDLWNEIHPGHGEESADSFDEFIHDLSTHVRQQEVIRYGRSHPQTVSLFGPELAWRPTMPLAHPIFRHPDLDFATLHIYQDGTIDDPRDTVNPAIDMARHVRDAISQIEDGRPFLDTEHGPIHSFKDHERTLPEDFDDEYFRHMQWAHLASGGAGGGMRWPNRHPHVLTSGMHKAQRGLAAFLPSIDWTAFRRRNISEEIRLDTPGVSAFGSADDRQAVVWLLRTDSIGEDGLLRTDAERISPHVVVPGLSPGRYCIEVWHTSEGAPIRTFYDKVADEVMGLMIRVPPFTGDVAIAIRAVGKA